MRQYGEAFKSRVLRRLVGPNAVSANALAREVGVSQGTLSRWLRGVGSVAGMDESRSKKKKAWTGAEKLRVVMEAEQLSGSELGAYLRREGLHESQLRSWREAAERALGMVGRSRAGSSVEEKRIRELERELGRKEKALAEAAALLVLKKKVQAIWGDEDDTTEGKNER